MRISRRMGVAVSGLAFAGAAVFTLGAAESASAQTVTVAPQHTVTSLVGHGGRGRGYGRGYGYARTYPSRWSGGYYSSYSFDYYKRTSWSWWSCGCCC